jgi:hypothetical protein
MSNYVKMTTPTGIAKYPYLDTPDTFFDKGGEGVYTLTLRLEKSECEGLLTDIQRLQQENVERLTNTNGKKPPIGKNPIPITEYEEEGVEYVDFKFKMRPSYKTKTGDKIEQKPTIFDSNARPIKVKVGFGSKVKVSFTAAPYLAPVGAGVALRLQAVQVLDLVVPAAKQGEAFEKVEGGFTVEQSEDTAETPQPAESPEQAKDATQF